MSNEQFSTAEIDTLLAGILDLHLDDMQMARFEQILSEPQAIDYYVDHAILHAMLRWEHTRPLDGVTDSPWLQPPPITASELPAESSISPSLGFLTPTIHSSTSYLSYGWPMAYLVATVIFGIGALIGTFTYVSQPGEVARDSRPMTNGKVAPAPTIQRVGQITGIMDCKWADPKFAPVTKAVCLDQTYMLASGLLEITYDSGAKVILQGPVTYRVASTNGGYLSVGKLTARVEKMKGSEGSSVPSLSGSESRSNSSYSIDQKEQPLFTVQTPTGLVTDLGTEFGIEVTKDQRNRVCVFQGKVLLETNGTAAVASRRIKLMAGESAIMEPYGNVVLYSNDQTKNAPSNAHFVRSMEIPPSSLIAYWPMNEGHGRAVRDQTDNHINLWFSGGEPAWTDGKHEGAARLLPGGSHLTCMQNSKMSLGKGDFTISLWFRGPSADGCWRWLLSYNGRGTASSPALIITTFIDEEGSADSKLRVSLGKWFTGVYDYRNSKITLNSDTQWYHIALVRNGPTLTGYVNGERLFSNTIKTVDLTMDGVMYLGRLETVPGLIEETFQGDFDDVAIWKRALMPVEIKALSDGVKSPGTLEEDYRLQQTVNVRVHGGDGE